jgi:RNA polymerase sigma-70 factor (ECF subfamily)
MLILPHLGAAYRFARWLTSTEDEARDLLQEACLRAYQYFDSFRGLNGHAWLLTVVRNTCHSQYRSQYAASNHVEFDEDAHGPDALSPASDVAAPMTPQEAMERESDRSTIHQAIACLPHEYRETLILRELEGLSYREIADVLNIPVGTVMSRLARARELLIRNLHAQHRREAR